MANSVLWYVTVVLFLLYFYIRLIKPHGHWKKKNTTYKNPWPIVGNMGSFLLRQKSFSEWIRNIYNECNGRYLGVYQFLSPMLLIKDPELIKKITIKDFDCFVNHKGFVSEKIDPLFAKNLFSLQGQRWRAMRSMFSPAFTGRKMRSMYVLMAECAENYANFLLKVPFDASYVNVTDISARFSNDVVATCAFGIGINSIKDKNNDFYLIGKNALKFDGLNGLKFFGYALSPMLMEFFKVKFISEEASDFYRTIVRETMEKREKEGIYRPDMINLLIEAKKGKLKYEESQKDDDIGFATATDTVGSERNIINHKDLSEDDLTSQALVFFLSGFEATAGTMVYLAHELATHPDIQNKLQNEIDIFFENHNQQISYDAIKQMKYLDMVVCELLRKWTGALIMDRMCTKTYKIPAENSEEKDLVLNVGDCVWIPLHAIHYDPKYYPNPERFDPERFNEENRKNINPYTYIPFGSGPRNCIGNRFALLQIKTFFIYLLRKFTLEITNETQIPLKINKGTFGLHTADVILKLTQR